jgi:hypothetical protein
MFSVGVDHKEHHHVHQLMTTLHRHLGVPKTRSKGSSVLLMDPPLASHREPSRESDPRWRNDEFEDPWGDRVV